MTKIHQILFKNDKILTKIHKIFSLGNDLRSGVCFLLRRGSNTASSFLKARDKQPQVRLLTSIYDFTRIAIGLFAE